MKSTMLLIARTDSESGKLLSSNIDSADHEFIVGTTTKSNDGGLAEVLSDAEARGVTGAEVDGLEQKWMASHEMCTFNQGMFDHTYEEGRYAYDNIQQLWKRLSMNRTSRTRLVPLRHILMPSKQNQTLWHERLRPISWAHPYSGTGTVSSNIFLCCFGVRLMFSKLLVLGKVTIIILVASRQQLSALRRSHHTRTSCGWKLKSLM